MLNNENKIMAFYNTHETINIENLILTFLPEEGIFQDLSAYTRRRLILEQMKLIASTKCIKYNFHFTLGGVRRW